MAEPGKDVEWDRVKVVDRAKAVIVNRSVHFKADRLKAINYI